MAEEELTTFKEVLEKHPKISQENLFKIVLVCKNCCSHKDLLVKFIKKKEKEGKLDWGRYTPYPNPYEPKPNKPPWNDWKVAIYL